MGRFFNETIRDMPSSEVKKLRKETKVTINPIYGQTNGFLEQKRKDFNKSDNPASEELKHLKMLDRMAKMREAKKKNG